MCVCIRIKRKEKGKRQSLQKSELLRIAAVTLYLHLEGFFFLQGQASSLL